MKLCAFQKGVSTAFLTILWLMSSCSWGATLYVDSQATGNNSGTHWVHAYTHLDIALSQAQDGDDIRVAQGIYVPRTKGQNTEAGQEATFTLVSGVALIGGFPTGGSDWAHRNPDLYETILSGDRYGDDGPEDAHTDDNCYHVLTASGTAETTLVEGFTITGGMAESSKGGGLFCEFFLTKTQLKLARCTFRDNHAHSGGAIYGGDLELVDCLFISNSAEVSGGAWGHPAKALLINCLFTGNRAAGPGGAIFCPGFALGMINCTVTGNVSESEGYYRGGGVSGDDDTTMDLTNCIFWANRDIDGIAESSQISQDTLTQTHVNHCCVQGWTGALGGTDNHGNAPLFVDLDGADNQLGTPDDNPRLFPNSPCLDVGDNTALPAMVMTDLDGDPRILDGTVDMGAYEGDRQGFILSTEQLTVREGQKSCVKVALAKDPGQAIQVQLSLITDDGDISLESVGPLVFDPSNYNHPQTLCLDAAQDHDTLNGTALVQLMSDMVGIAGVTVTEWDDDTSTVIYVDQQAVGTHDGSSWSNAYSFLQDALATACPGNEIWVAAGIYIPGQSMDTPQHDRNATFQLLSGVSILGGFPAGGDWLDRDPNLYPTILSGDRLGNDMPITPLEDLLRTETRQDNCYHVLTGSGADPCAVLDGFTICGGVANEQDDDGEWLAGQYGAGCYIENGSPTLQHCTFEDNAAYDSAGVYNRDTCHGQFISCVFRANSPNGAGNIQGACPTYDTCLFEANARNGMSNQEACPLIQDCIFRDHHDPYNFGAGLSNSSGSHAIIRRCVFENNAVGQRGGALYCTDDSDIVVEDCVFRNNEATWYGGAFSSEVSDPIFRRCRFENNRAVYGGAISVWYSYWYALASSSLTLENCLFIGNQASKDGGAVSVDIWQENTLTVTNCTFANNDAGRGRALFIDSIRHDYSSNVTVTNCICWDGGREILILDRSTVSASYSNVQDSYPGTGNISMDPRFVDIDAGDAHLKPGSICIDTGTNASVTPETTDLDGYPRIMNHRVDMGAYEWVSPGPL